MHQGVRSPAFWQSSLKTLGFHGTGDGSGYVRGGLLVRPCAGWCTLERSADGNTELLDDQLGKPGLWKPVVGGQGKSVGREFHVPLRPLQDMGEAATLAIQACLEWAMATACEQLPEGWVPPPLQVVESWIPKGGLTLQSGPFVRQASLLHGSDRLAVRFPIVPEVSDRLSESRRAWLDELLIDGQNRWRMVRIGRGRISGRLTMEAEVDLSGAPHTVLEDLFKTSLDALRWVVSWLVWPAGFLADKDVDCRAWEVFNGGRGPQKGESLP